jgi:hypothetical protein
MMKPLIVACLLVSSVVAADPKDEKCPQNDQPHGVRIRIIEGKPVTEITGDIIVCPHIPRPGVVYVTAPKTIDYVWETFARNFLPQVVAAVKKAPF